MANLRPFAKRFSDENTSTVQHAVKKARREIFMCKMGKHQQLDHCQQVLEKSDNLLDFLTPHLYGKVKQLLEESSVLKRI
jgi:hypothetical protein